MVDWSSIRAPSARRGDGASTPKARTTEDWLRAGLDPRIAASGVIGGTLWLHLLPRLPAAEAQWWWTTILLLVPAWRYAWLRIPVWIWVWGLVGFGLALGTAHGLLAEALATDLEGRDVRVRGVVASIPRGDARRSGFLLSLRALELEGRKRAFPRRVRVTWYDDAPRLRVGERLDLTVRLKRPHGFLNPGGFDYEGWLFHRGIRAKGYVRARHGPDGAGTEHLDPGLEYAVGRLRQRIGDGIAAVLPDSPYRGLIQALAIGDRYGVSNPQWDLLRQTGTAHLLAISGLHVGLVAGLAFFCVRGLWGLIGGAALRVPAPVAAATAATLAAAGYALLAGFSLSTQRALIMVLAVVIGLLLRHRILPSRVMALAALAILGLDPFAVASAGFWLSFGAVAVILYGMGGRPLAHGWWWRWGRVQWLVAIGLLPVSLYLFQRGVWVAPLANLAAVPWVSLMVVPPVLAGGLLSLAAPNAAAVLLGIAEYGLAELWALLEFLAGLPLVAWTQPAPPLPALLTGLAGAALVLAPRGFPGRWLGWVLMLPLVALPQPRPDSGTAWFTLLDVGHGLAAVVRTHRHALVYDTGPRLGPKFDTGRAVVVPFLRHQGIARLDKLIVSHGDNDHIGGAAALLRAVPATEILTSVPERFERATRCRAGREWTWDGVRFRILHPRAESRFEGNNASCVLRVDSDGGSVLLAADIERAAERRLLNDAGAALAADVLVAPHQGSRTSSTPGFVAAVRPRFVLFPVAYRNRYRHPHAEVSARYRALGAQAYSSAEHGALCFVLPDAHPPGAPRSLRHSAPRHWHTPPVEPSGGVLGDPTCW